MNRKLKQQLKQAFEAPEPKRKQQFLQQIEQYHQKEQTKVSFWNFFSQKWVWATSFSAVLILVSMFGKVPMIEFDSKPKQCSCHTLVYMGENHLYSYSKCITCGEVKGKIELVASSELEFFVAEEVLQSNIEIKLR